MGKKTRISVNNKSTLIIDGKLDYWRRQPCPDHLGKHTKSAPGLTLLFLFAVSPAV